MQRLVIIDYGSGNLHSAAKAFERAARESSSDTQIVVSSSPRDVATADRVVLPGVGAFADCKRGLDAVAGMREALETVVRGQGRPLLGICVGQQLMATRGLEHVVTDGLGWIAGEMAITDPYVVSFFADHFALVITSKVHYYGAAVVGAVLVLIVGRMLSGRQEKPSASLE